uniref:Coiled-coil domain-containing protein 12 n=1 Tax=Peromyscus maniculatus bairdii TaxID=230844 RepID=A0A8C8SWU5_PERMB
MAAASEGVGRLEEEEKTGHKDREDGESQTKRPREEEEEDGKHRVLRLWNHVLEDEDLKRRRRVPQGRPVVTEENVKEQLEAAKPEPVIEEVDLANLKPRKLAWDLKRDVAKKLEKLEKQTQTAIAELVREPLKARKTAWPLQWMPPPDKRPVTLTEVLSMSHLPDR